MDEFDIFKKRMVDLIGFDDLIDRLNKNCPITYPPHNIEKYEHFTRIVLAVAGFDKKDLSISLHDNELEIVGTKPTQNETCTFIYKGIANRNFRKSFLLENGMEIKQAGLSKGLLSIIISKPYTNNKISIPIEDLDGSDVHVTPELDQ